MSEATQETSQDTSRDELAVPRRLSRRALMKAAGIAPFLALAKQAWAHTTPAHMAAVALFAPVPEEKLKWAKEKAGVDEPSVDKDRFELVVRALWVHFHEGLGPKVGVWSEPDLLELMYITPIKAGDLTTTGAKLAENVADPMKFDPFGNDYQTNTCAYICGHKAALLAKAANKKEIDANMYVAARKATQEEMAAKLAAARMIGVPTGSPPLGFGC